MKYPEGTIKTNSQGAKFIKNDGKWVYLKKPREEWNMSIAVPKQKVVYNYPPIKIPSEMKETEFPGYYITEDGRVYRRPGKCDRNGKYGKINEYGLIELKPALRGNPKYPEHQYECVNISIIDENGNYKQIKRSIHQLVAEAFVSNPNNYNEIDHIDRNKLNNNSNNLRWTTQQQNVFNTLKCINAKHIRTQIINRKCKEYIYYVVQYFISLHTRITKRFKIYEEAEKYLDELKIKYPRSL